MDSFQVHTLHHHANNENPAKKPVCFLLFCLFNGDPFFTKRAPWTPRPTWYALKLTKFSLTRRLPRHHTLIDVDTNFGSTRRTSGGAATTIRVLYWNINNFNRNKIWNDTDANTMAESWDRMGHHQPR
jgi:hypothetical protein